MNYYFKDKRFKTRAWTFIVYPDSAPDNWRDILDDLHIPWCESPLHDKDQNPTGEQKKAHWHVLLYSDGPKSFDNVTKLVEDLNCPEIRPCNSIVGLVILLLALSVILLILIILKNISMTRII